MSTGHVAHGIDHRQDDQAEGEGDADVGNGAATHVVDDDGSGPGEHQGECAQHFGGKFSHSLCSSFVPLLAPA